MNQQFTAMQLSKVINRSYKTTCGKLARLVDYKLAYLVQPPWRGNKKPKEGIYELLIPVQALIDEPEINKVAKEYGIIVQKIPKTTGMSEFTKFCANPFNLGAKNG